MAFIQQLSPHIADLIAAGEVVERPASVVKELVENAIDAGSSAIVVEIQRGGMGLIRVTDNGCGIAPTELPTAFLRHATSKLRSAEDLGSIATLGFRGEALAAISAVSRVEITSCEKGSLMGARLRLEGGVSSPVEDVGAPEGTTIAVRDLFYNTPARLKFMRKDSAETAAVAGLMQHLALSHPSISFRFIKDGVDGLHTPGDGKLSSAIYAALGRDFAKGLQEVEGRGGEISVHGYVTQPLQGRGSRSMQTFFVNGRFIKSPLLTTALEEGYRNQIMKGKFPGCVLFITLPVTAVDVNVHPAKTQVKFAREKDVFDAVYHTVLDGLDGRPPSAAPAKAAAETTLPRGDFFQTMDAKTYREKAAEPKAAAPSSRKPLSSAPAKPAWNAVPAPVSKRPSWDTEMKSTVSLSDIVPEKPLAARPAAISAAPASVLPKRQEPPAPPPKSPPPAPPKKPLPPAIPQEAMELPGQETLLRQEEAPWRMVGEVLHTYIVCESQAGEVYLIDKHAAHERINFDRLMSADTPPMVQALLRPIAAQLERQDAALLLEHLDLLTAMGFICEDFGDGALLVREVPSDIDEGDVAATLEEFAQNLRSGKSLQEKKEQLFHTMACKAAIKGGWVSDPKELRVLVEKVQRREVQYCPHGRPVCVKLTKYEIEKMFKRA